MLLRPVDLSGDILPVLQGSAMLSGAAAVARLAEYRLNLYTGDWWENPSRGNEILDLLKESRLTEADAQALSTYLSSYVRETPGVKDITGAEFSVQGQRFSWKCTVMTEYGSAAVAYGT